MKIRAMPMLAGAGLLWSAALAAGPDDFEPTGFIVNDAGEKCRYQQEVTHEALYFHGDAIAGTIGEIVFEDPQCMKAAGEGLDANKTAINEAISEWYSHPDADFDTRNLWNAGLHQEVGQCMQSRSYAAIAIAVDYIVSDSSIVKVVHGPTLEGCID